MELARSRMKWVGEIEKQAVVRHREAERERRQKANKIAQGKSQLGETGG